MHDTQTDESLMLKYAQGDNAAFELLYARHKDSLYRYFLRQCHDAGLAQDLFQELWGRVIKAASNYKDSAKFTTWIYRIGHNLLVDQYRALKPVDVEEDMSQYGNDDNPAKETLRLQQADHLKYCMNKLPQVQLEAFLLKEESGLSAPAIADVVGASMEACKSRLRYAYERLRECLALKLGREVLDD